MTSHRKLLGEVWTGFGSYAVSNSQQVSFLAELQYVTAKYHAMAS
jgi:hypothetical protein